jgi:hypothetical protein
MRTSTFIQIQVIQVPKDGAQWNPCSSSDGCGPSKDKKYTGMIYYVCIRKGIINKQMENMKLRLIDMKYVLLLIFSY